MYINRNLLWRNYYLKNHLSKFFKIFIRKILFDISFVKKNNDKMSINRQGGDKRKKENITQKEDTKSIFKKHYQKALPKSITKMHYLVS